MNSKKIIISLIGVVIVLTSFVFFLLVTLQNTPAKKIIITPAPVSATTSAPSEIVDYLYLLDSSDKEIFTIDSNKYPCTGSGPMECYKIQYNQKGQFLYFYDQIEGFNYEAGYEYVLLVGKETVINPPADGSSIKYTLLEMLSKTKK
ncbi:MAG: DUF4377 domain-containing protein [Candidatus Dojkabacteria bacterium]